MVYGAIIGDIAGSIYEFNNIKHKPLHILPKEAFFTDDTVMTMAVAFSLTKGVDLGESMRTWARIYPNRGYGYMFSEWLATEDAGPYYSFGNGAAMRVSPAAWVANSLEEAQRLAEKTAVVTHNHPEGIKGAKAVASAIYLAKIGVSKKDIKKYISKRYRYDLSRTCDEIRPTYEFNETCQDTIPQAITAFLESRNFKDSIRLVVSLGGDSDTLATITGSIAEAYYGIPKRIKRKCNKFLPDTIRLWVDEFEAYT